MNNKLLKVHYTVNFIKDSVDWIVSHLLKLEQTQDIINIALSGGSTPLPILEQLKEKNLQWGKYNFFLVDERIVDLDNSDSNYYNLDDAFFSHITSSKFPMLKDVSNPEKDCKLYETLIEGKLPKNRKGIPSFDLILLGMGTDGHTASLFPNTAALLEHKKWVVINKVTQQKQDRITITYPVLKSAKKAVVLIKGDAKKKILNKLIVENSEEFPISNLVNSDLDLTWISSID